MINLDKLSLSYDGKALIVQEIDLCIDAKSITALVGPNGCGKSTLLRGISRLLKPITGSAYLEGHQVHTMAAKELAKRLGILPQAPVAPEGLTVHELVAQGRYPHQSWLQQWSREDEQIVLEALDTTNLTAFADRAVDTLSGGQRQRAWIAMTLAQQTEVLLLDEPTTYLDMAYQVDVLDLLADLHKKGHTIVMVLHDLNQAARYADTIVAMKDGEIVTKGTPQEVVTPEVVLNVFGLSTRVITDPVTGTPMCIPSGYRNRASIPDTNKRVKTVTDGVG